MDRHADVFFSDEDIARFADGRVFLGDPLPDGDSKSAAASPFHAIPDALGPMHILPTANQYLRIREREERNEFQRTTTGGEPCVTVDSLPFVHDQSNGRDRDSRLYKENDVQKLHDTHSNGGDICLGHEGGGSSEKGGGYSASEGGSSDELISSSDEDEKCDQDGVALHGRNKKRKQVIERGEINDISFNGLRNKSDVQVKNDTKADKSCVIKKRSGYDLYSEQSTRDEDGGDSNEEEVSDDLISFDDRSCGSDKKCCVQANSDANSHEPCTNEKKSGFDLYSEQSAAEDDGEDSSEEEFSDDLISSEYSSFRLNKKRSCVQAKSGENNNGSFGSERKRDYDLYSEQSTSEDDGVEPSEKKVRDELMSLDDSSCRLNEKSFVQAKSGAKIHESCMNKKKNSHDLYSEQSENGGESSEEEISDDLISSNGDDDKECDLEENGGIKGELETLHATAIPATTFDKSKTLITLSEAIGSSIIKSIPHDSRWHSRRSESEAVLSRIMRNKQRSLLKRPKGRRRKNGNMTTVNSPKNDTARPKTGGEAVHQPRRTTLRFAAAPVAVNKRKKQMSLKSMFKKT